MRRYLRGCLGKFFPGWGASRENALGQEVEETEAPRGKVPVRPELQVEARSSGCRVHATPVKSGTWEMTRNKPSCMVLAWPVGTTWCWYWAYGFMRLAGGGGGEEKSRLGILLPQALQISSHDFAQKKNNIHIDSPSHSTFPSPHQSPPVTPSTSATPSKKQNMYSLHLQLSVLPLPALSRQLLTGKPIRKPWGSQESIKTSGCHGAAPDLTLGSPMMEEA
ncbi:hypothetical protein H8959_010292 [Pygathrix nigripes]